ncbi:hypothetical protein PBN151_3472 [Paenibacillus sp. NAIST15-1]|nr:hypothetical protein PBN151_3472 [Paenibacillus sp. NAIST15-1]
MFGSIAAAGVEWFARRSLMRNIHTPAMSSTQAINWVVVNDSPNRSHARTVAPTGSPSTLIEIDVALVYFNNQLNSICPSTVGMTAINANKSHSLASYPIKE